MFKTEYELIKLIGLLLLVAHFIACGFFYVGTASSGEQSWIYKNNLQEQGWSLKYLDSLYFSVITMITIGYGDITPISPYEKIYVMCITFVGCGLFAYSINAIGEIIRSNFQKQESFLQIRTFFQKLTFINFNKLFRIQQQDVLNYLQKRQISKQLMLKVIKQLEYIHKHEKYQNGEYALQKLNEPLQNEVKIQFYGKIIKSNKIFSKVFSQQFLNKLALIMKDVQSILNSIFKIKIRLYPNETVIKKGEYNDKILFIYQGLVNQVFERDQNDYTIQQFKAGSLLNFRQFVLQKQSENTYKSVNICTLVYCEYNQFKELLQTFKEDYVNFLLKIKKIIPLIHSFLQYKKEKFYKLKDLFLQDIKNDIYQSQKCNCCNQFSHETYKCSCLCIVPQKDVIIKRYIFPYIQARDHSFTRSITHKTTLKYLKENKTSLKEFRIFKILQEQKEDIEQIFQQGDIESLYECDDYYFYQRVPIIKNVIQEDQIKLSGVDIEEDNLFNDKYNQPSLTSVDQSIIANAQVTSQQLATQKNKLPIKQEESQLENFNKNHKQSNKEVATLPEMQINIYLFTKQLYLKSEQVFDQSPLKKNSIDLEQKRIKLSQLQLEEEVINKQKNSEQTYSQSTQEGRIPQQSSFRQLKNLQANIKVNSPKVPKPGALLQEQNTLNFDKRIKIQNVIAQEDSSEILDVFVNEFDKMKEYKIYFPHNNYSYVLNNLKKTCNTLNIKQKTSIYKKRQSIRMKQNSKNTSTTFKNNNIFTFVS